MAWPLIHCNHAITKLQSEIQHLGVINGRQFISFYHAYSNSLAQNCGVNYGVSLKYYR